jgi:integration host factor subunit alpha
MPLQPGGVEPRGGEKAAGGERARSVPVVQQKLTKAEIVDRIHEHVPVSKKRIQRVVDFFIEEIKRGLREDKIIELRGFGTFEVKIRKGRRARNPRTGERVTVANHGVALFRPGKGLKEQTWSLRE